MSGGFWKAPRLLASLLTTRGLTPTEFTLLVFLGISGADRSRGLATTNEFLATSIGVSDKTLRRSLRSLRARGFVTFEDHPRVAGFRVRTAVTLEEALGEVLGSFETPSVTAEASDTSAPARGSNHAPANGLAAVTTSDIWRVSEALETETETETENHHLNPPPGGGGLSDRLIKRIVETVGPSATAREAHDQLQAALEANGFRCEREVFVDDRGDGRRGRLDLVAYDDAGNATAFELDYQSPRDKSLTKLRSFPGGRIVVLREGPAPTAPDGIDAVYSLNPSAPRGRGRRSISERIDDLVASKEAEDAARRLGDHSAALEGSQSDPEEGRS